MKKKLSKLLEIDYHPKLVEIMIKGSVPSIYISGVIVPLLVSIVISKYIDNIYVFIWIFLNLMVLLVRIVSLNRIKDLFYDAKELKRYIVYSISIVIFITLLYSSGLILISSYVPDLELFFLVVLMISMIAGSVSALIGIFHAYAIYVIVNSLSIIGLFFYHGGQVFDIFAFTTIIFMFMMLKNGYIHYKSLKENILLKETFEARIKDSTRELQEQNIKLNASLKNFKDLLDSSMVMIVFHTHKGEIVELNQEAIFTFGYNSKAEAIGKNIKDFVPKESLKVVKKALDQDYSAPYELLLQKEDGSEFSVLISAKSTVLNSQKVRMVTMMDLTETKEKDILLQRQAKLAQMGEMISMIAHQWRQPLSAISAASAGLSLKSQLGVLDESIIVKTTEDISNYSQHLSETIDDFRNFFKPNKSLEFVDFCELTRSVLSIVEKSLITQEIELILELECQSKFKTYPNELKQVILNLIQNAQDALIENNVKNPYIKIVTSKDEDSDFEYSLSVCDNAGGISDEVVEKIFEPYFSTKLEKNGSGLGLYMSKTIVEEHCNGRLSVTNNDDGALFTIMISSKDL